MEAIRLSGSDDANRGMRFADAGPIGHRTAERSLFPAVTEAVGSKRPTDAAPSSVVGGNEYAARVAAGSTLAILMQMDPSSARTYADAVVHDIRICVSAFRTGQGEDATGYALTQIHGLKNLVSAIGAGELLDACETLRVDTCRRDKLQALEARYRAIGNAAILAVVDYTDRLAVDGAGGNDSGA